MMKEIGTPNFGLQFLRIAKEYCEQTGSKNNLEQATKIIIFTAAAVEAIANMESIDHFSGKSLDDFIKNGSKSDKRKVSPTIKKWDFLMKNYKLANKIKKSHLKNLSALINTRNEILHFKPHKNQTEKVLVPKKNKIIGPDGQLYIAFRKTGFQILRKGVLNSISLIEARNGYRNVDSLVFDFYRHKKTWPHPDFSNKHWGRKSPFWKLRGKSNI